MAVGHAGNECGSRTFYAAMMQHISLMTFNKPSFIVVVARRKPIIGHTPDEMKELQLLEISHGKTLLDFWFFKLSSITRPMITTIYLSSTVS